MVLNAGMTQDGGMAAAENTMPSEGLVSIGGYPLGDPHANPAIAASHSRASGTSTGSRTLSSSIDTTANRNGTGNHAFSRTGHNPNGLNSIRNSDGIDFLIDQIRAYGRNLTVLVTGPLTDVDAAITASPDIIANLRLVIMGGTLTQPGNCWDGVAETNIMQDPEAANRVFHSGADVTMVGLDVTHQCLLGSDAANIWRATGTERGRFLADIADFSIAANLRSDPVLFRAGMPLHDPLAAAVALDPTLVDCFDIALRAETETGDIHGVRGRTIGDPSGLTTGGVPRTHVALNVDKARFTADFTGRLTALCRD
jgi:inosine-uridine nucleoside N-ribohydrolase